MKVGGVIRRHRERQNAMFSATNKPNLFTRFVNALRDTRRGTPGGVTKCRRKEIIPLPHKVERRGYHQGAALLLRDGHHRDVRLAGARREHHDASPMCAAPCVEGLSLKRSRLAGGAYGELELLVLPSLVNKRNLRAHERSHDVGVRNGWSAQTTRTVVVRRMSEGRQGDAVRGLSLQLDGSGDETQRQHGILLLPCAQSSYRRVMSPLCLGQNADLTLFKVK